MNSAAWRLALPQSISRQRWSDSYAASITSRSRNSQLPCPGRTLPSIHVAWSRNAEPSNSDGRGPATARCLDEQRLAADSRVRRSGDGWVADRTLIKRVHSSGRAGDCRAPFDALRRVSQARRPTVNSAARRVTHSVVCGRAWTPEPPDDGRSRATGRARSKPGVSGIAAGNWAPVSRRPSVRQPYANDPRRRTRSGPRRCAGRARNARRRDRWIR